MAFMKHKSVQRFMAMWVHEETKDIDQPIWNYDSFARVSIRNHELKELYTDKQFYSCTFTDGHYRWGTVFSSMTKRNPQYQTGR